MYKMCVLSHSTDTRPLDSLRPSPSLLAHPRSPCAENRYSKQLSPARARTLTGLANWLGPGSHSDSRDSKSPWQTEETHHPLSNAAVTCGSKDDIAVRFLVPP